MNRNVMFIVFAIFGIVLGFGIERAVLLIAHKIDKKEKACVYSCLLGISLTVVLLVIAYFVMPAISNTVSGHTVSKVGVIV